MQKLVSDLDSSDLASLGIVDELRSVAVLHLNFQSGLWLFLFSSRSLAFGTFLFGMCHMTSLALHNSLAGFPDLLTSSGLFDDFQLLNHF